MCHATVIHSKAGSISGRVPSESHYAVIGAKWHSWRFPRHFCVIAVVWVEDGAVAQQLSNLFKACVTYKLRQWRILLACYWLYTGWELISHPNSLLPGHSFPNYSHNVSAFGVPALLMNFCPHTNCVFNPSFVLVLSKTRQPKVTRGRDAVSLIS